MFPEGYIILYTNPNGAIRKMKYNPKGYERIEKYDWQIDDANDN